MTGNTQETEVTNATEDQNEDPYVDILRGLSEGILLTVNESDPSQAGTGELRVTHVDDETGEVIVEGFGDRAYSLKPDDDYYDGPVILETGESEFSPRHDPIMTIEIIGIA